jgi:DNA-binding PadR family transcriptional regulator
MARGVLRYLLLDALRDGPKHGYEVIKWLEERTHGRYSPSPGTVYPTLQLLQDQGLVTAEQTDERRVYRLTAAGQNELTARAGLVQAVWERFPREQPGAGGPEFAFARDELDDLARTTMAGLQDAWQRGDAELAHRLRLALERCKSEIRELIARRSAPPPPKAQDHPPRDTQGDLV